MRLERLGKLKDFISSGTRTGDLPACNIVPQPTTLPSTLFAIIDPVTLVLELRVYRHNRDSLRFVLLLS
jgi:hypothetical protein